MKIVKMLLKAVLYLILAMLVWAAAGAGALYYNEKLIDKVVLTDYTVSSQDIPDGFDGYKIMVVSDLHDAPFSDQIAAYIDEQQPDALVFTGDMVQLPDSSIEETVKIAKAAGDIPIYAVSGNHERQNDSYDDIMWRLSEDGIVPLENDSVLLENDHDKILLVGVKDPKDDVVSEARIEKMKTEIGEELKGNRKYYSVLLSHRADLYPELKDTGVDLILSGHLHGGIVRLPYIGGLISDGGATGMDFMPEYDYGYYQEGDGAAMIVSAGCDKNPKKKRFFNPPEVVVVTLESE